MATLIREGKKLDHWRIEVFNRAGERHRIRLGKLPQRVANAALAVIEDLAAASIGSYAPSAESLGWLTKQNDKVKERVRKAGLVAGLSIERITLSRLVAEFTKHAEVKKATAAVHKQATDSLIEMFGPDRDVRDIGPLDADNWRAKLKADGYAEATVAKRVKIARQIFARAVRWKMIDASPFAEVKTGSQKNAARQFYVSREIADKVLAECKGHWRTMFILCRYGGLRCPSEVLSLRWSGIDFTAGKMLVWSPKTAHHPGGESRTVPLFPEVRAELESLSRDGEYVVPLTRTAAAMALNFRTQLQRIIERAGVTPWPRLFQNLRSSRQTELEAAGHPSHVVCRWLGNSERVAQGHYLQVTDSDFRRAAGEGEK